MGGEHVKPVDGRIGAGLASRSWAVTTEAGTAS